MKYFFIYSLGIFAVISASQALDKPCSEVETSTSILDSISPGATPEPSIKHCSNFSWYYCPRDPGCATYAMSAHQVTLSKRGKPVIKPEGELTIFIDGVTTLDAVPVEMSFMIYAIDGGNAGGGPIGSGKGHYWDHNASLDLNHAPPPGPGLKSFRLEVPFNVTEKAFDTSTGKLLFNIGLDVFQKRGGSDEGMCVQISNWNFVEVLTAPGASQEFDFLCHDHGNGTFEYPVPLPNPDKLNHLSGCNERHQTCGCIAHCVPGRASLLSSRID